MGEFILRKNGVTNPTKPPAGSCAVAESAYGLGPVRGLGEPETPECEKTDAAPAGRNYMSAMTRACRPAGGGDSSPVRSRVGAVFSSAGRFGRSGWENAHRRRGALCAA